ncbi:hypothetical protein PybrP1_004996 [[Pythium] brassicae (nom. inval.)]|nr:hypothetical protein PybrP1_004996 [[Pythium] brassicae (nom. inval.)]
MRVTTAALLLLPALWTDVCAHRFADFRAPCTGFQCSAAGEQPAPKREFEFTANGCGTAMLPISAETDFSECCNWHDACYSTCGMKKATCEKRLDKCMKAKCAELADAAEKDTCKSTAQLFSLGAQMIACPAFQDAQREACRCVAKDEVRAATRERLAHFLATSGAPAQERTDSAVDALLAKYVGKEPTMFLRLLLKYPHALKRDAKKRNFMEDIFKPSAEPSASTHAAPPASDGPAVASDGSWQADGEADEHIEL